MVGNSNNGWWSRLRERGVIRVGASYALIAWLLLQIADVTFEPLGVPRWVMVALIVAALVGFPIAVALAWFYEVGDRGIERDTAGEGAPRPIVHGARRYADIVIIAVLVAAVAVLLVRQSPIGGVDADHHTVAVLPFENLSRADDGDVLALGIAEAVLHQLANLAQLEVISRTSSFSFRDSTEDARVIGEKLGARYLLEGSVQSDRTRMRVTTQLIDTQSGADVWSMRFDRPPGDVFAVQDEIAMQVARALELSLDANAKDRLTGQGTSNLDAYLAFLQGRSLLANHRVVDMREAIAQFERSITLDPKFAAAYVSLAEAELFVANYDVTDDRETRFDRALEHGRELVDKALELDPQNGDAYLQRAHLTSYDDLQTAEVEYRHGLELSPNSAQGYAGLAEVVYEDPKRRDQVLELLDRARKLDPLEPAYDVTKAVFLLYERSDVQGADELLSEVVKRNPNDLPGLARLCELRSAIQGQLAEGIMYCERARGLDPLSEAARLALTNGYLSLGDEQAAEAMVGDDPREADVARVMLLAYRKDWVRAGELAYEVLERRTHSPSTVAIVFDAIRMHARKTGDFERARVAIAELARVSWSDAGEPVLADRPGIGDAEIALADMLLNGGEPERGRKLLGAIIARMNHQVRDLGRPELWYFPWHPVALALAGQRAAALGMLERSLAVNKLASWWWFQLDSEPAFEPLRSDRRFAEVRRKVREHVDAQRAELARLRSEGLVPDRTAH